MRRFIAALSIVFIGLWAAGAPAWAVTETQELNYKVSGPFTGTNRIDVGCPSPTFHQLFDLTVRPAPDNPSQPLMLGTLHIDTCLTPDSDFVFGTYRGTFQFISSRGATLSGTVTGTSYPGSFPMEGFNMELAVSGGTSSFKGVTGRINLAGTWGPDKFDNGPPPFYGPSSGTSTGALQRPK